MGWLDSSAADSSTAAWTRNPLLHWGLPCAGLLVVAIGLYLLVRHWRSRSGGEPCEGYCGATELLCPSGSPLTAAQELQVRAAWDRADANRDGKLDREELLTVIAELPQLWAMLEVNTGIEASRCQDIATCVAMTKLDLNKDGFLSWHEFRALWTGVLLNPHSQLEFFHRAMFNAFDADGNQVLDKEELAAFIDMFYREGGPYKGDARLPDKAVLTEHAMERLDKNGDGVLSFQELEPFFTGHADILGRLESP